MAKFEKKSYVFLFIGDCGVEDLSVIYADNDSSAKHFFIDYIEAVYQSSWLEAELWNAETGTRIFKTNL